VHHSHHFLYRVGCNFWLSCLLKGILTILIVWCNRRLIQAKGTIGCTCDLQLSISIRSIYIQQTGLSYWNTDRSSLLTDDACIASSTGGTVPSRISHWKLKGPKTRNWASGWQSQMLACEWGALAKHLIHFQLSLSNWSFQSPCHCFPVEDWNQHLTAKPGIHLLNC
jgi:hypothetical protein